MKQILTVFLAVSLVFACTSGYAAAGPPRDAKLPDKEVKSEKSKLNQTITVTRDDQGVYTFTVVCYDQEAFTPCGTFAYTVCFESEPSMDEFLDVIDIIDAFINEHCT